MPASRIGEACPQVAELDPPKLRLLIECIYQRALDLPEWAHPGCDGSHRDWQLAAGDAAYETAELTWKIDGSEQVDHLFARAAAVAVISLPESLGGADRSPPDEEQRRDA